jgi:hypothetical protein
MTPIERAQLLAWADKILASCTVFAVDTCCCPRCQVAREMRAAAEQDARETIALTMKPTTDDLTCLLCHKPSFDPSRDGSPRCEYETTYRTTGGTTTAGVHRQCYERQQVSRIRRGESRIRA